MEEADATGIHMTVVNEMDPIGNGRRHSDTSRDSLNSESDGKDNPAFEGDEALTKSETNTPKVNDNSENNHHHHHPVNGNKEGSNHSDVEMVPLNPSTKFNNKNSNGRGINGSSTNNHKESKNALDNVYNDYFRPVNTRRKLLR